MISLLCVVLMYECFLLQLTLKIKRLERLLSVIVNVYMRAVVSLQQISGKLKTVFINSTGQRKLSGETESNF